MRPERALGRPDQQVPDDGKHAHDDELVDDDDDEDDDDDDERKLYKIENYQDSSYQNFSSRIVFFLNVFDFSKNRF